MIWYLEEADPKHPDYERHGGPYDRGDADCYYGRLETPHYYKGATGFSERVEIPEDQKESNVYKAYMQGYMDRYKSGEFKDWGTNDE